MMCVMKKPDFRAILASLALCAGSLVHAGAVRRFSFPRWRCAPALLASLALCAGTLATAAETQPATQPSADEEEAWEEACSAPDKLARHAVQTGLDVLENPEYEGEENKEARREKLLSIMRKAADLEMMSERTLARYRRQFSESQMEEFVELFSKLVFQTYIGHVEDYSGGEVNYDEVVKLRDDYATMSMNVHTSNGDTPIEFSMRQKDDEWRIYDLKVEGVSLVRNYRSQFRDILSRNSPDHLLKTLRKKVEDNDD